LAILCDSDDSGDSDDSDSGEDLIPSPEEQKKLMAEMNLHAIDRHTRKLLQKHFNFGLIQSIEAELLTCFMDIDAAFMRQDALQHFDLVPASPKKGRNRGRGAKNASEVKSLGLSFKNSKDRKVCHGVCKYYSLHSISEGADGSRVTTVSTPNDYPYKTNPPPLLSEYLWENYFRS